MQTDGVKCDLSCSVLHTGCHVVCLVPNWSASSQHARGVYIKTIGMLCELYCKQAVMCGMLYHSKNKGLKSMWFGM